MEPSILGQMLFDLGFVTEPDLERCLQLQRSSPTRRPLGTILVEEGLVDPQVLEAVLAAQATTAPDESAELQQFLANATGLEYLDVVGRMEGSTLHLSTGRRPAVRKDGRLVELPADPLTFERSKELVMSLLTREQHRAYHTDRSVEALITVPETGRFRANVFRHNNGIAGVFRRMADAPLPLDALGVPAVVRDFAALDSGLVLITGPADSGRSTTLAAMIETINQSRPCHIITLEDVVETPFESRRACVTQREVDLESTSCAEEVRRAQREDADVITLADLRGPEVFASVLAAAEAGHLMLATLHTRGVQETLLRLVEQFPEDQRPRVRETLAHSLRGILYQELLPRADEQGRVLASEVMFCNPALANLVREGRTDQVPTALQMHRSKGMQTIADSVQHLVDTGQVTAREARPWLEATFEGTPRR